MSSHTNPYLQGGWTGMPPLDPRASPDGSMLSMSGSSHGGSGPLGYAPPQSSLGSLPMAHPAGVHISPLPASGQRIFRLAFRANPSDFFALDPGNNPMFRIYTGGQPTTQILDQRTRAPFATIEWRGPVPKITRGGVPMDASEFLRPLPGTAARGMLTGGAECRWTSDSRHFFLQRNPTPSGTIVVAAMVQGSLEIRISEIALGQNPHLLGDCVLALVLLQGRVFVGLQ